MSTENLCRFCLTINNGTHLNIFSVIGMEMKMSEIISEHFKCEIRINDSMPNFVCESCWQITEAFHELYEKSKLSQEKLLSPSIKIEPDINEPWSGTKLVNFMEVSQLEIGPIKVEPNMEIEHDINDLTNIVNEESDSNGNDPMDFDGNTNDSDEYSSEESSIEENEDDTADLVVENTKKLTRGKSRKQTKVDSLDKPRRKKEKTKVVKAKFEKSFAENKQLFDMSCDLCSHVFETLNEARHHYNSIHDSKGYIKCCKNKLFFPSAVLKHLQRHLDPNKFKCLQCDKIFLCDRQLAKHTAKHNEVTVPKEKNISCSVCLKLFTTQSGLEQHMKRHKERDEMEDGNYVKFIAENFDMKCDHCDTIFDGFHDARRHYKQFHNETKGYLKCCKIKLRELWMVSDHIKSHLDPTLFRCDICDKNFVSRMILVQHKRRHRLTMNKNFVCDYCGKCVRDKDAMLRHMFTNHVDVEPTHECEFCHKKFRLPQLLKNHFYSVHREKKANQTCEICGKNFHVKFHLDKHILHKHTDKSERLTERKQCEWCGEWLMTKSGIFYHHQKHTSGIQKCQVCQMEFSNRVALLGHIRQHHREHKFKCSYCDKTFPISSALKKHEESHTRHNTYPCRFCTKVFSVLSSRQTHTKRNHAEEWKQIREMEKIEKLGIDPH